MIRKTFIKKMIDYLTEGREKEREEYGDRKGRKNERDGQREEGRIEKVK